MGNLIADIFVTVKPTAERLELTERSLSSLCRNTEHDQFRLTLCFDGQRSRSVHGERFADYILESRENEGLGPTINRAIAHISSINDWWGHRTHGDPDRVAPYIVMCQDDLLYTKDWLPILASRFRAYGMQYKLGFASGLECVEHATKKVLVPPGTDHGGIILKDWVRAAQMMGTREYWQSLMPIPRFDPETGRLRAKPNDGMGSGVDWWLIRNHENSVCRTGRTCLVMPGLVQHAGYDQSTWLQNGREMPESDSDKERVRKQP